MSKLIRMSLVATLLWLCTGAGVVQAQTQALQTLRIGIEGEYPPFNQVDGSGNLVGFDVDISHALCEEMKIKCMFVVQSWNGIIPALLANKSDLIISSMAITDKRRATLLFSSPYYLESAVLVAPKKAVLSLSPEALKGKVVGVQSATTYERMLKEKFPGVTVRTYGAISDHNLDLISGRIDAIFGSKLVMSTWLTSNEGKNFEIKGAAVRDEKYIGYGAGIAARKSDTALIARVNTALDVLHKNGKYDAISKKYFNFDINL